MSLPAVVDGALLQILSNGERAERILERALRGLSTSERTYVARTIMGVALHRGTLFFSLHNQPISDDGRVPPEDVPRLRERFEHPVPIEWPADEDAHLAVRRSLPRWLAALWNRELGSDSAHALAVASNIPGPVTIRANLLRTSPEALLHRLAGEGVRTVPAPLSPTALQLLGRPNIFALPSWRAGFFEIQDEGSQCIVDACEAKPGQTVIDWCAGSGGKTLGLAARMQDAGTLIACDVDQRRLDDLTVRLRRSSVRCVQVMRHPAQLPIADVVLVDAPCSSLGTLRRGPDARWRISPDALRAFPPLQRRILDDAAAHVCPGGHLLYATCTLNRAENEDVANAFEQEHPEFTRELEQTLLPHVHGTDGFYLRRWRRKPTPPRHCARSGRVPLPAKTMRRGEH